MGIYDDISCIFRAVFPGHYIMEKSGRAAEKKVDR